MFHEFQEIPLFQYLLIITVDWLIRKKNTEWTNITLFTWKMSVYLMWLIYRLKLTFALQIQILVTFEITSANVNFNQHLNRLMIVTVSLTLFMVQPQEHRYLFTVMHLLAFLHLTQLATDGHWNVCNCRCDTSIQI